MDVEKAATIEVDGQEVRTVERTRFAVGVDLGQAHDPTAVCVVARSTWSPTNARLAALPEFKRSRFDVVHLERLPLGTSYPRQVDAIESMMLRDPLVRYEPALLVDYTGVGRPVFDMFKEKPALRRAKGVVITGGREVGAIAAGWSVPKVELVSKLQALLHSGQLRIPRVLPEAAVLARELQDFRVRYSDSGNAIFNAREGAHDDLVLALALGVFGLSRPIPSEDLRVVRLR